MTAKIVSNQFHNRYYAFAILTLRNAHCVLVSARQISVANATMRLTIKPEPKMSTIREHLEPKVDVNSCRTINCCSAFLRDMRLAITANDPLKDRLIRSEVLALTC